MLIHVHGTEGNERKHTDVLVTELPTLLPEMPNRYPTNGVHVGCAGINPGAHVTAYPLRKL